MAEIQDEVRKELHLKLVELDELENIDLGILAVNHKVFFENKIHNMNNILKEKFKYLTSKL